MYSWPDISIGSLLDILVRRLKLIIGVGGWVVGGGIGIKNYSQVATSTFGRRGYNGT